MKIISPITSSGGLKQDVKWRMARDEPGLADWGRSERVLCHAKGVSVSGFCPKA